MAKTIKRHPIHSDYGAAEDGTIISFKFGRQYEMGCGLHKRGYKQFRISYGRDKSKQYLCHRLVWECFNGVIPAGKYIHHIDHNKINNSIDNLQLVTDMENKQYALEAGVLMGAANPKHPWYNGKI
jgi:hypothetical protein